MRNTLFLFSLFIFSGAINAQEIDTFYLHVPVSINDTIIYKRIIRFDHHDCFFHVRDYYPNGQIQLEGTFSFIDKRIKEESL